MGLTGGIGAGKSAVSRRLVEHGAALVDADVVAREVVRPGTPGLAEVVAAFGEGVLGPDGGLDRQALGKIVFGDDEARARLNAIVHPEVGERTLALATQAQAAGAQVLVHDVPLLVENGLAPSYHLVVVVEAPVSARLHRLTVLRGMSEDDARARIAAQASDADRRAVADVLLQNDGPLERLRTQVDALAEERLLPYAANVAARRPAVGDGRPPSAGAGERLVARLRFVCGQRAAEVRRLRDDGTLIVEVRCRSRDDAGALDPVLAAAGFPRVPTADLSGDGAQLHRSSDPGRPADVRVRTAGTG